MFQEHLINNFKYRFLVLNELLSISLSFLSRFKTAYTVY